MLLTSHAIIAIVCSVLALSLGDALIKFTGASLPLWQLFILRSAVALPILWVVVCRRASVPISSLFWVTVRSLLLVAMWLCYYFALPLVPLSAAAAAYYTAPILIALVTAVAVRKSPDSNWATLLPLVAAFLYALAMVLTSFKCQRDSPIVLAFALNVAFIVCGALLGLFSGEGDSFLLGQWKPLNSQLVSVVAVLAAVFIVGSVGAAFAYQNGSPATIAIFDYAYLVFSVIWGILFFSEFPDTLSLSGIAAILVAGYLVVKSRERSLSDSG